MEIQIDGAFSLQSLYWNRAQNLSAETDLSILCQLMGSTIRSKVTLLHQINSTVAVTSNLQVANI